MSRYPTILVVAAAVALAIPTGASAAPIDSAGRFAKAPSSGKLGTAFKPQASSAAKSVDVLVELSGAPVAVVQAKADRMLSGVERTEIRARLKKAQDVVAGEIASKGGRVLSGMQSAINGIRVRTRTADLAAIGRLPGVKAIHAIPRHSVTNTVSVPFLGVPSVWSATHYTGIGVKIAIIDTGIDYTHADFGGPGTTAAYDSAHLAEAQEPDPALVGPDAPRIKGGYDFVGDAYDADAADPVVRPDENPLDCNGHGTHVAGTAAGTGVLADGSTYAGTYDATTPSQDFKVGPGVAPQADLYALRVFGCEGSTDYATEAIDWAVRQQMDVINLSLGSTFGQADDIDAIAASNAVGAGVVVVASAGNAGPNPYLVGAPAAGHGVVSVAAVDSTETFPGAELDFGDHTARAINANGATLPSGPYTIVVVGDDESTVGVDESLGCSANAFTQAGVASESWAPLQLAVVKRGDCARAAKAIFGQEAGADAVLMVNNADGYPPFEGKITSNPDDGTPALVTIPFLGVPSGTSFTSGDSVTLTSSTLQNPAFRGFASFSSGGPRSGDSGLAPSVSAPGVSISSAGSGTGSAAEVLSGTSMAAPHVAGVAALAVQAHPTWSAADISSVLVSTADPDKVNGNTLTLGGTGLVDAAQSVGTQVIATGDSYATDSGKKREPTLSYGFIEPTGSYSGVRTITLINRGSRSATYSVAVKPSTGTVPASVSLSTRRVTVKAHKSATVKVKISLSAAKVGSSLTFHDEDDQWAFREVSGSIVLTAKGSVLRVPYLAVPRAQAKVTAALTGANAWLYATSAPSTQETVTVKLTNPGGALAAAADFYSWGLSDGRDLDPSVANRGFDLRAAGAQSLDTPDGKLVVFALNNFTKASNAASNEFDVSIDTDADGKPNYVVFSADSGAVRSGSPDGYAEVFIHDTAADEISAAGFLAMAPTDSSTLLLPVLAADLGLTEDAGDFSYQVASYSAQGPWSDKMGGLAKYNPFRRAIADGSYLEVSRNSTLTASVDLDTAAQSAQRPRGLMVVVFDNKAGQSEAMLLGR